MADFGSTINAVLDDRKIRFKPLIAFDFADGEEDYWGGDWDLVSGGKTWKKLGGLLGIDGIDQAASLESSMMTFTLSGVQRPGAPTDWLTFIASGDRSNYVDRLVTVYAQFWDEDWQPLDTPKALKVGLMASVAVSRVRVEKSYKRSVSLSANNVFYGRSIPSSAFYTDRDQKKRAPGDLFMEKVAALIDTEIPQPWH